MEIQKVINLSESSIKVTKTTKGYTWEIKVYDEDETKIIPKIQKLDLELKALYEK